MIRFIRYWALAGVLVPVGIITIAHFQGGVFEWPYLGLVLWPSWIFMAATYEQEFTAFGILVLTISIAINVVLYSGIGALVWLLLGRPKKK